MRSSLLPRRPLRRVCDACKQKQRNHAPSPNFSQAAALSTIVPSRNAHTRQPTSLTSTTRGASACDHININSRSIPQPRHISTASSARPAEAEEPGTPAGTKEAIPVKSHYDLFPQTLPAGPPPAGPFAIDVRALRREFLTLQATAHPDLAPPGATKRRAEAVSARINEAYRTLAHPLLRAQHLLHLQGLDVANEETARVEDPALLMLVLDTREAIEEALSEDELEPLRVDNEVRIEESEERLADLFAGSDTQGAREEVVRLRYWTNIRETIRNWERGKPIVLQH
ncbi:Co-chaperone Hsc20 [Annulohypoxylon bovei var. microspora]|nr:Co-chaperone Hsc20 [Annulohypoxylon bovei var. microspora]